MAKLNAEGAGWNAGRNYYAKTMRVEDILIDPLISQAFIYKRQILDEVCRSIRENGYDKSQPIAIWKGANIVVDGHTRLEAAKEAGLTEVPVAEMEFAGKEEAILYTFERQLLRRNLTQAEILTAVEMMPERKAKNGEGRAADDLAGKLGVSAAHLYR
ncbi:MAG: ParB/RepB/Spo0J family partition protein, partial [Spirochaetaceae bacterium]|nr:ParB/RepB/Spo0J family partition protein [Spirochaetaceae bacterium]